jgi:hypothetical protein
MAKLLCHINRVRGDQQALRSIPREAFQGKPAMVLKSRRNMEQRSLQ